MSKLKLLPLLLLALAAPSRSHAQAVVVGQACGAGGLNAIATNGTPVICTGNPLVWTSPSSGGGSLNSSPQQTSIRISTQCSASDPNCFQVFQDGQLSIGSIWSANTSNGSTATLLTTNANEAGVQYLQSSTPQTNIGGIFTSSNGLNTSILAAFKISGTLGAPASCSGVNDQAASATSVAVSITPANSGSGSILIAFASNYQPDQSSITFADNNGNTWLNALTGPTVQTGNGSAQMGYVQNNNAGATTVTATFGASAVNRSIFVCNFSGMASASVLDAAVGGISSTTTIYAGTLTTTTGNDLLFQANRSAQSGGSVFTVGTLGVPVNTITTNAFDPPYAAAAIGQKVVLTTACDSTNGFIGLCSVATTNPSAKIIAVNSAHNITVNTLYSIANTAPDANGFTGWLGSAHDDGAQYAAAFAKAITIPGSALFLPCGMTIIGQQPFNASSRPLWNPTIRGCVGENGTVLVPSLDFNYAAAVGAIIANIPNNNTRFVSPTVQTQSIYGKIEKFAIWGLGAGRSLFGVGGAALPILSINNAEIDNVDCSSYAYGTTGTPQAQNNFLVGTSLILNNVHAWICGGAGVVYGGNTTAGGSVRNSYFQTNNNSIQVNGSSSTVDSSNNALYGNGATCSGSTNYSVAVTAGQFASRQDQYAGIFSSGGIASIEDDTYVGIGICGAGFNVSGTGYATALKSRVDSLTMSAGSFVDLGGNYKTAAGTPWTTGTLSITGGTVVGTASIGNVAVTAPKLALSAGWGTTASWTTGPIGFTKRVQGTVTASGTGQAANPTITYTFPTPFAQATNIVCKATQIGGTQAAVANPFTVGIPTATSVVFTYTGTPGAGNTLQIILECDAQ